MKYTFLLAAIITSSAVFAQSPWVKKKPGFNTITPGTFYDLRRKDELPKQNLAVLPEARLLATLPNGNKVFALPQDHMPCIVPDMNQFQMPNRTNITIQPYRYNGPGAIPNPALPIMKEPAVPKKIDPAN